ncbi:MAG: hypothetical protein HY220_02185 [Candidatus Sungbacteria bacterium]|uniref:DUF5673 domain-containing protein n=1 Tax=Candidatus Sungiibacteriota bacterium TaxID=2750080 RepID=A0A9D6LRS5_9BACT|nr:hypothetical protein [Candidatus Sungbacteria bacterium]
MPDRRVIDLKNSIAATESDAEENSDSFFSILHSWRAPEYHHIPKERNWYIAGAIIAGSLLVYSLMTANYFFAIFTLLATFIVYTYSVRLPKEMYGAITSHGVQINNRLYGFEDLNSFWIFYEPGGIKELSLESKKAVMPYIRLPLGDAEPVKIREILVQYVPEVRHEESLAETLSRFIGF